MNFRYTENVFAIKKSIIGNLIVFGLDKSIKAYGTSMVEVPRRGAVGRGARQEILKLTLKGANKVSQIIISDPS